MPDNLKSENEDFEGYKQLLSYLHSPISKVEEKLKSGWLLMLWQREDNKDLHLVLLEIPKKEDYSPLPNIKSSL